MADSVAQAYEGVISDGETMVDPDERVEQLAANLAARNVLETQETPVESQSGYNSGDVDFFFLPEALDLVDRHSASGVLDRDKFIGILDEEGCYMSEILPLLVDLMDEFFRKAAAWVKELPDVPQHERDVRGIPPDHRPASVQVYDDFNMRTSAISGAQCMGAARLESTLWELRAKKHAYDRQQFHRGLFDPSCASLKEGKRDSLLINLKGRQAGAGCRCREAYAAVELAYAELKGVLDEFLQVQRRHLIRPLFVRIVRSRPLVSKLLYPSNAVRALNLREFDATPFDR